MEKFSRKLLADYVNFFIWIALIGLLLFGCFVLALFMSGNGEIFPGLDIPVTINETNVGKIHRTGSQQSYTLIAREAYFKMRIEPGWRNKIWIALTVTTLFAGILTVVYQVKNIVRSFRYDEPFDYENLYRIRIIAFMFIGFFIGKNVFIIVLERYLTQVIKAENLNLAYDNGAVFLCLGLAMLMLEAAFKRGVILEEDDQLTI